MLHRFSKIFAFFLIFLSFPLQGQYNRGGKDVISMPRRPGIPLPPSIWKGPATKADDGNLRALVILASFKDVPMTNSAAQVKKLLNEGDQSAATYFKDQTGRSIEIVVAGPVTLPSERSYYGTNDEDTGEDLHAGELIADACTAADASVDFSTFDMNADGHVDHVFVIYAGTGEHQENGKHPEYVWPHQYSLKYSEYHTIELDGVTIDYYACSSELEYASASSTRLCGIGTFCHEFSHIIGLIDLYDTDYEESGGTAAGVWGKTSLMDKGNYNNGSCTPPNYNAIEKELLGVIVPEEFKAGSYNLFPIGSDNAKTYKISHPEDPDEYYLFEYRSQEGWDKYIGGKGLLVYHIDKSVNNVSESIKYEKPITSAERWSVYNEVNCRPDYQCADLIEADSRVDINPTDEQYSNISGVFFPQNGIYSIGGEATVKMPFRDGTFPSLYLRDILLENDGTISFVVADSSSPLPPVPEAPPTDDEMVYIVTQTTAEGYVQLSVSNAFGATVKWYYLDSPIEDPDKFRPTSPGEIRAEIFWEDGTKDIIYKRFNLK